jgi:hypothetical protein
MTPTLYITATAAAVIGFAAGGGLAWQYQGARLEASEAKTANLGNLLEEQNGKVAELAQASEKAGKEAIKAALRAAQADGKAQAAEKNLRAAIASGTGPQTCEAAIDAIRLELKP